MRGFLGSRCALTGLLGALMLVVGAGTGWASGGNWCQSTVEDGTNNLDCSVAICPAPDLCNSNGTSSTTIPISVPYFPYVIFVPVTYRFCACGEGGGEDWCCHIVVITDPPEYAGGSFAHGPCYVDGCYNNGTCTKTLHVTIWGGECVVGGD